MLSQLHTIKDRVENVSVVTALLMNEYEFFMDPNMKGHFLMTTGSIPMGLARPIHLALCLICPWNCTVHILPFSGTAARCLFRLRLPDGQERFSLSFPVTVYEKDLVERAGQ
jgi:hypothetical protein